MNIGEAAKETGVSAKMIRYYEETELIAPPARTAAGYRVYGEDDLASLHFIRRARDLGFSMKEITDLLGLWRNRERASGEVKAIALNHIADLERRMEEMRAMAQTLAHLAANCQGDSRPDCPIIAGLAGGSSAPAASRESPSAPQHVR